MSTLSAICSSRLIIGLVLMILATPAGAVSVKIYAIKDNTLYFSNTGNSSNGAGQYFFSGKNKNGEARRGLVQFDLSSIPSNATITSATLRLNMSRRPSSGDGPPTVSVALRKVSESWGEGTSNADAEEGKGAEPPATNDATWVHRFYPGTSWSTPGGVYSGTVSATIPVSGNGRYYWSGSGMVADIQSWVTTPSGNNGWLLLGNEGSNATARRFDTRQYADSSRRPLLEVTYFVTPTTGACCHATGTCTDVSPTDCATAGGVFQGFGVPCSPNPCPQPAGACCFPNGTCTTLSSAACATASGTYQGDGSVCSPELCPIVLTPFVDALPIPAPATPTSGTVGGVATYDMPIREVRQRLHRDLPLTTVWGYAGSYPGPTIEATTGLPVTVNWINDLRDSLGVPRTTHYLHVDTCMHGPNHHGSAPRVTVHLHGGHVPAAVDGYPEVTITPGQQLQFVYPNTQQAGTAWYHDHALGITRLNVIMGLAGFYLIRDPHENGLGLPSGEYEIPLAIQDRTFNPDGSLSYPEMWMEHFFGDKILVNGKVWPFLNVKRGKYRFRLLNGSTSRTYTLALSNGAPFWQIGTDLGLIPRTLRRTPLTLTPGERMDVVVDFSSYAPGTEILLTNSASAPFPGAPGDGVIPNVMKFIVTAATGHVAPLPDTLRSIAWIPESEAVTTRELNLLKVGDACTGARWTINNLLWDDITEYPMLGSTEIWSFINRTGVVHPMHMHLVQFQILDRQPITVVGDSIVTTGPRVPPDSSQAGWKDTAPVMSREIVRVIARFEDYTGRFPYHCHILEHEDHEMMRQFEVVPFSSVGPGSRTADVLLGQSYPNPSSGALQISFSLTAAARVRLMIEDIAGRRVATMGEEPLPAGAHEVHWHGLDNGGRRLAPGVYFYRLLVDGRPTGARRMVAIQ